MNYYKEYKIQATVKTPWSWPFQQIVSYSANKANVGIITWLIGREYAGIYTHYTLNYTLHYIKVLQKVLQAVP